MKRTKFPFNKLRSFPRYFFLFLSSFFFLGYLPSLVADLVRQVLPTDFLEKHRWTGAGFLGSLAGVVAYHFLPWAWVHSIWILAGVFFVTILITHAAERITGIHDDPRIILDEFLGVWVACWGLSQGGFFQLGLTFVLFRFFDAVKGPWARPFQRLPGGLGITLDDVSAGVIANALTRLISAFFH